MPGGGRPRGERSLGRGPRALSGQGLAWPGLADDPAQREGPKMMMMCVCVCVGVVARYSPTPWGLLLRVFPPVGVVSGLGRTSCRFYSRYMRDHRSWYRQGHAFPEAEVEVK